MHSYSKSNHDSETSPLLYIHLGVVLSQVLLDEQVGGLFGFTEACHDERQAIAQSLSLYSRSHHYCRLLHSNNQSQVRARN